jgi:hypothetical protein
VDCGVGLGENAGGNSGDDIAWIFPSDAPYRQAIDASGLREIASNVAFMADTRRGVSKDPIIECWHFLRLVLNYAK